LLLAIGNVFALFAGTSDAFATTLPLCPGAPELVVVLCVGELPLELATEAAELLLRSTNHTVTPAAAATPPLAAISVIARRRESDAGLFGARRAVDEVGRCCTVVALVGAGIAEG